MLFCKFGYAKVCKIWLSPERENGLIEFFYGETGEHDSYSRLLVGNLKDSENNFGFKLLSFEVGDKTPSLLNEPRFLRYHIATFIPLSLSSSISISLLIYNYFFLGLSSSSSSSFLNFLEIINFVSFLTYTPATPY